MSEPERSHSRKESVLRFAKRHDPEPAHSRQVARLALRIFDQTAELHGLDNSARELLEYACMLHDIGWSGGQTKHKRRSYEMVKAASLEGFSDAEREIVASVARYHGTKPPRERHLWNQILSPEDKRKVRYLSAIIRIADALDTSHRDVVEDIECSVKEDRIVLKLKTSDYAGAEIQALRRKKDYFEGTFRCRVELA